jgi:4-diphosphocytidyl-2-C-methyl-D-erythritol kinase
MYVRQLGERVRIDAPAKVNLSLEVIARRDDGFHEIETLIVAIDGGDTLEFVPQAGGDVTVVCRWAAGLAANRTLFLGDLPQGPENIAWRAISRLRERAGISAGCKIDVIKRIPSAAGLGGASADAAAALIAANRAWRLNWPLDRPTALAAELGSDVPFFLGRGAAICRGRGERIEAAAACRLHLVLARPPVGLSTPAVYGQCRPAPSRQACRRLEAALTRGLVAEAARMLDNRLEQAAEQLTPWIARLRGEFSRQGVLGHQMSGSGSSCFGVCWHARHARRVAARLRSRRVGWVRAAVSQPTPVQQRPAASAAGTGLCGTVLFGTEADTSRALDD